METFAYLGLCLYLLFFWVLFFWLRPDLRRRMIPSSIVGAVAGPISEIWYFQDYWLPPSTMGVGQYSLEDILLGFGVSGIAVVLVRVLLNQGIAKTQRQFGRLSLIPLAALFIATCLLIGSTWLQFNSCVVSSIAFLLIACVVLLKRPDLLKLSLLSGASLVFLVLPAYLVLFVWLFPDWWAHAWIVTDPFLRSFTVFGIPLTEFFWYFTWGMMAGVLQDVRAGTRAV